MAASWIRLPSRPLQIAINAGTADRASDGSRNAVRNDATSGGVTGPISLKTLSARVRTLGFSSFIATWSAGTAAGPISLRAICVQNWRCSLSSVNIVTSTGTASLAAGPILLRVRAAQPWTPMSLALNMGMIAGTAETASGPSSQSVSRIAY